MNYKRCENFGGDGVNQQNNSELTHSQRKRQKEKKIIKERKRCIKKKEEKRKKEIKREVWDLTSNLQGREGEGG